MTVELYIGADRLDLFKEESIQVVSAIQDFKEIDRNIGDFSKSFTVPAGAKNNRILKHWYDIGIDNSFDARTRQPGEIQLGGIPFRYGKWKLNKITEKSGKIQSYELNFFSNLVKLKDIIGGDELTSLDLSAYNHQYNGANVLTGLQSGLFSGAIRYTLQTKRQYFYDSTDFTLPDSDALRNIAWRGISTFDSVRFTDLLPSIQVLKIIEGIETKYDLTFTRQFFDSSEFNELYLWCDANREETNPINETVIDWDGGGSTWMDLATDIGAYPVQGSSSVGGKKWFALACTIIPDPGFESVNYTLKCYRDNDVFVQNNYTGAQQQYAFLISSSEITYNCYWTIQIPSGVDFEFTASLEQTELNTIGTILNQETTTGSSQAVDSDVVISQNLPKIKIIDFLKGLFGSAKLIVKAQDNGDLFVDTLNNYYSSGSRRDITQYVDWESVQKEAGALLNPINFKFEDPQAILNTQFKINTRLAYGDEEVILEDADGQLIEGDEFSVELPFEVLVYDRLSDLGDGVQTNIMYAPVIDLDLEPTNPAPVIHYAPSQDIGDKTIAFNNGVTVTEVTGSIYTSFHGNTLTTPNYVFLFSAENSEWDGQLLENTLYKNHWENFILSVFDVKKRIVTYKAKIPRLLAHDIQMNDVLVIKGDEFRIDRFEYELQKGDATFKLINTFSNKTGGFSVSSTDVILTFEAQSRSISIAGMSASANTVKQDTGYGTGWATVVNTDGKTTITVTENTTGLPRDVFIEIDLGSAETGIYVLQYASNPDTLFYVPELQFDDFKNSMYLSLV